MNSVPLADAIPVAAGETPANRVAALFDAHHARLYRLARRLVPGADDALDLVQETFLKVARAPMTVPHGDADEEAWLVRILVNIRRDQWRKAAVRRRHDDFVPRGNVTSGGEAALVARADVWRALDVLAPRRRAVVVMHELEELDVRGIARVLGISTVTVRWHLSRGRRELARILTPAAGRALSDPPVAGRTLSGPPGEKP